MCRATQQLLSATVCLDSFPLLSGFVGVTYYREPGLRQVV